MSRARRGWRYVPATSLGPDPVPHVVVDGAARPGTVCTLSHWPGTPTPAALRADLSAEIVLEALARPKELPRRVEVATVDHYDADGAIALALLVTDGLADAHGRLLCLAARAGDFDVVLERDAGRVAFALEALRLDDPPADPDAPDEAGRPDHPADATALGAQRALAVLPALADRPDDFEELWGPEERALVAARRMVADGAVRVDEHPLLDLAVVRVDPSHPDAGAAGWDGAAVHRAAVHAMTSCLRVATVVGRHYDLRYRYESWVRLATHRPCPRVDLDTVALALERAERDGGPWGFDGAGAITPVLRRRDGAESTLAPERFLAEVCAGLEALDRGPPAWDPYRPAPGAGR